MGKFCLECGLDPLVGGEQRGRDTVVTVGFPWGHRDIRGQRRLHSGLIGATEADLKGRAGLQDVAGSERKIENDDGWAPRDQHRGIRGASGCSELDGSPLRVTRSDLRLPCRTTGNLFLAAGASSDRADSAAAARNGARSGAARYESARRAGQQRRSGMARRPRRTPDPPATGTSQAVLCGPSCLVPRPPGAWSMRGERGVSRSWYLRRQRHLAGCRRWCNHGGMGGHHRQGDAGQGDHHSGEHHPYHSALAPPALRAPVREGDDHSPARDSAPLRTMSCRIEVDPLRPVGDASGLEPPLGSDVEVGDDQAELRQSSGHPGRRHGVEGFGARPVTSNGDCIVGNQQGTG